MVFGLKYWFLGLLLIILTACGQPDFRVEDNRVYIVRPGDSLYLIGQMYGLKYRDLAKRNHIPPPYRIYVGQRIYLTGHSPEEYNYYSKQYVNTSQHRHEDHQRTKNHQVNIGKWIWPLHGQLSSHFGIRERKHHDGIDILAKKGTPIRSVKDGVVVFSGRQRGYGNIILIRHSGEIYTAYAHNDRNLVRKGSQVSKGQIIASVGKSGRATTPHLHFEVRRKAKAVNPLAYLPN